jgi:hypothetical protein
MPIAAFIIAVLTLWWTETWPFDGTFTSRFTYQPEVGYYEGTEQRWYVGSSFSKQDECVGVAVIIFNRYNAESAGRAFSWACRKIDRSGAFIDRVR